MSKCLLVPTYCLLYLTLACASISPPPPTLTPSPTRDLASTVQAQATATFAALPTAAPVATSPEMPTQAPSPTPTPTRTSLPTSTPFLVPTPAAAPTPTPTLTVPQIFVLLDRGQITAAEAADMLGSPAAGDSPATARPSPVSPSPRPLPTATPTSTTPTEGMEEVECSPPKCNYGVEPLLGAVNWLEKPSVSPNGTLAFKVQIGEDDNLILPGVGGGASNIVLSGSGGKLYGSVVPPSSPGWNWTPEPGLWIADTHIYQNKVLTVRAQIDPKAATTGDLKLCLWAGGTSQNRILGCIPVEQP